MRADSGSGAPRAFLYPHSGRGSAVERVIRALRRSSAALSPILRSRSGGGLSAAQALVMRFIMEHPKTTPRDVATFTGLTAGTITGFLDGLEAEDLVRRERSDADRRVVHLLPGPDAERLLKEWATAPLQELFSGWSGEDLDLFSRALNRLALRAKEISLGGRHA
ncbi:MAG: MarR family winged helix-turn-helix transcriptional regulator [Thermoplasmatota archaeon]